MCSIPFAQNIGEIFLNPIFGSLVMAVTMSRVVEIQVEVPRPEWWTILRGAVFRSE